jgi:DNA-directed RNA polymerase subunit RPC12/RpoP
LQVSRKLQIPCPHCGSLDVFYSCEPKCCFNHVCGDCKGTFEPLTTATGERRGITPPEELPDPSEPAVACVKCDSVAVYVDEDDALVCADCGSVLALELTELAAP